jgi:ABC-type transport system involved in cytochrome bd biosynthesis fused ATPase/permease subunit
MIITIIRIIIVSMVVVVVVVVVTTIGVIIVSVVVAVAAAVEMVLFITIIYFEKRKPINYSTHNIEKTLYESKNKDLKKGLEKEYQVQKFVEVKSW